MHLAVLELVLVVLLVAHDVVALAVAVLVAVLHLIARLHHRRLLVALHGELELVVLVVHHELAEEAAGKVGQRRQQRQRHRQPQQRVHQRRLLDQQPGPEVGRVELERDGQQLQRALHQPAQRVRGDA